VKEQQAFGRTAISSVRLVIWGLALYGVLRFAKMDLPWQHHICGPWGCGAPPHALAACHLFWLLLLFPPALMLTARFPPALVGKVGWALIGIGAVGIAAIVFHESTSWLPQAFDWQRRYFVHRCLFSVATLVEVPFVEALVLGAVLSAHSSARANSAVTPRGAAASELPMIANHMTPAPVGEARNARSRP
jgi:hypothetical protein